MHNAHTQHFKVVANKYAYSTSAIFPAVFTYMCILIALRNVVFWTTTRTRFPCVEILVPMIWEYMLLIVSFALYLCWLACVSDMAFLRISEKRVIFLTPPPPPPYLYWMVWCQYSRCSYMILGYKFLNMYPALSCAHSKKKKSFLLIFMCLQVDVSDSCVTLMF